jgi:hypothetical protein
MSDLNRPTGCDERTSDVPEWTPARGLRRAAGRGMITAVILILLLLPIAKYAPPLLNLSWLQIALGFALTWILLGVVQNAAGIVGWPCTGLGCGFALLVLAAAHVAEALFAAPSANPSSLSSIPAVAHALFYLPTFLGMIIAAMLCHRGTLGAGFLTDLLMSNPLYPPDRR